MSKHFHTDSERKYSAPTDYLRSELVRSLYLVNQKVAKYRYRGQTGLMREIMQDICGAYRYFMTYARVNGIKFSNSERKLIRKTERYYSYHDVYILPAEAKQLLDLLTRLAYKSGLYNVHRLQSPDEEGI